MGIMLGAVKVEQQMELNIVKMLGDFMKSVHKSNIKQATKKSSEIETTMERDRHAIDILKSAMDLAMKTKTVHEYRLALNKIAVDDVKAKNELNHKKLTQKKPNKVVDKTTMVNELQANVQSHLKLIRDKVGASVQATMKTIDGRKKSEIVSTPPTTVTSPSIVHMNDIFNRDIVRLPQLLHVQVPPWPVYQIDVESFYRFRRQNDDKSDEKNENQEKENDEEDFDDGLAPPANNGGFAGLLAGLSGGEGGSDVGALIGAISGVITNLFGPGGLDIPSLLSTGTSLIAGLLGGDENFGKVLGSYIGLAVEGLSGGGGAVSNFFHSLQIITQSLTLQDNNGAFFGNFVGTLFASLSAVKSEIA